MNIWPSQTASYQTISRTFNHGTPAPRSQLAALDAEPRRRGSRSLCLARDIQEFSPRCCRPTGTSSERNHLEGPGTDGQAEPHRGLHAVCCASFSQSLTLLARPEIWPRNALCETWPSSSAVRFRSGTAVRKVPACSGAAARFMALRIRRGVGLCRSRAEVGVDWT